eukprot:10976258-Alexandrium_andersonii.AAC.1
MCIRDRPTHANEIPPAVNLECYAGGGVSVCGPPERAVQTTPKQTRSRANNNDNVRCRLLEESPGHQLELSSLDPPALGEAIAVLEELVRAVA